MVGLQHFVASPFDYDVVVEIAELVLLMRCLEYALRNITTEAWAGLREEFLTCLDTAQRDNNIDLLCAQLLELLQNITDEALSYEGRIFRKQKLFKMLEKRTEIFDQVNAERFKIFLRTCRDCIDPDKLSWSDNERNQWSLRCRASEDKFSVMDFYKYVANNVDQLLEISVAEFRERTKKNVQKIECLADTLEKHVKIENGARIFFGAVTSLGGSASVAGGVMVAVMSPLAGPVTIIVGGSAGAIAGVGAIGFTVYKNVTSKKRYNETQSILDDQLQSSMICAEVVEKYNEAVKVAMPFLEIEQSIPVADIVIVTEEIQEGNPTVATMRKYAKVNNK